EMENLLSLVEILDEEVFGNPAISNDLTKLKVSFKSKWWKECHRVFSEAAGTVVYYKLDLSSRPGKICHTANWTKDVTNEIRKLAKRWTSCPIWEQPQSTDPNSPSGVDFTSNNEATVKKYLNNNKFTTQYLEGR